ncbi:hypothetical protein R3P38DRAFT_2832021 [Favolaschia claudopus]|uniref:Uncharacterized protein n=1 Tax=Favolaschia claudopus TaxID=2862362 RepID=A0AAW0E984_9AGAR
MPKASSSARTRRPGPLMDLPLDAFLPPNPNLPDRPNKRVHSPGTPGLFSPQKRRILEEEGFRLSPRRSVRVRAISVKRNSDGDSPVKKLDFGPPKNSPTHASASLSPSANPASPQLTRQNAISDAFSSSSSGDDLAAADYFSSRPSSTQSPAATGVTQTPRDLPPPVDPQSIHYPGFVVFQDVYIITSYPATPDTDTPGTPQKDGEKENAVPRRKPRKSVTAPTPSDIKARLCSPSASLATANSMPCTPGKSATERLYGTTPTPRRSAIILTRNTRVTPRVSDAERRELRQRLVEEADELLVDED